MYGKMAQTIIVTIVLAVAMIGCGGGGDRGGGGGSSPAQKKSPIAVPIAPPANLEVSVTPDSGSLIDHGQVLTFHLNKPGQVFYSFDDGGLEKTPEMQAVTITEKSHLNGKSVEVPPKNSGDLIVRFFGMDEDRNETGVRSARYRYSHFKNVLNNAVGSKITSKTRMQIKKGEVFVAEVRPLIGKTVITNHQLDLQ